MDYSLIQDLCKIWKPLRRFKGNTHLSNKHTSGIYRHLYSDAYFLKNEIGNRQTLSFTKCTHSNPIATDMNWGKAASNVKLSGLLSVTSDIRLSWADSRRKKNQQIMLNCSKLTKSLLTFFKTEGWLQYFDPRTFWIHFKGTIAIFLFTL